MKYHEAKKIKHAFSLYRLHNASVESVIDVIDSLVEKEKIQKYCGKKTTWGDFDSCLGALPGVANACCGHGIRSEAYIQFTNGVTIRGFILEKEDL